MAFRSQAVGLPLLSTDRSGAHPPQNRRHHRNCRDVGARSSGLPDGHPRNTSADTRPHDAVIEPAEAPARARIPRPARGRAARSRPSQPPRTRPAARPVGRPHGEKAVVVLLDAAAATHGDESRIPHLGENHPSTHSRSLRPSLVGNGIGGRRSSLAGVGRSPDAGKGDAGQSRLLDQQQTLSRRGGRGRGAEGQAGGAGPKGRSGLAYDSDSYLWGLRSDNGARLERPALSGGRGKRVNMPSRTI